MSNDIRDIIQRLATVEGKLTPGQQKVPQLPALFKPRHIRALGSKTDPAHPMDGYMVGDSIEPRRTALEEAMAEIEEDMLSKVKRDLTTYLDRLEKKVSISRDLKDKAKDAVERGQAEEEIDEFAPVGGDDREPDEEEILRQLAAQWWNGTEQQMAKAQNTLAAMGWEIGQDESGDDDAGVFVIRAGDENGNSYMAFPHSELDLNEEQGNDFNTYTTNAQGQRLQQSPNLMGVQQTKNLDTGDTTTDYNQGPMSASQTKNAAGATTAKAQSVDLGVAKFGTKQQQPNYAAGQLASPTVAKVSVPAGDATVTQKSYAGPMLGGASGPGVGNNVITKAAQVVPNANPAKNAVDPAAAADATATANQLSQAAAPALNKQPGLQERSRPVETFEMADGSCLECYGDDEQGYELRRQGNSLPSRFKTRKHAKMAVDLFRARRKQNQDLSQDYIEEK
jgi:hypothetical protein